MIGSWQESINIDSAKKQKHHFANQGQYSQGYNVYSSHVQLSELDHKEGRQNAKELMTSNCGAGEGF